MELKDLKEAYDTKLRDLEVYERRQKEKRGDRGAGKGDWDEEYEKLKMKVDQAQSEIKLMQDEFFRRDKNHQEALDKKKEEKNEALRELERIAQKEQERTAAQYRLAAGGAGLDVKDKTALEPLVSKLKDAESRLTTDQTTNAQTIQDKYAEVFEKFQSMYKAQKTKQLTADLEARTEFEKRLHGRFDQLLGEMGVSTHEAYDELITEFAASTSEMRAKWSNESKAELEQIAEDLHTQSQRFEAEDLEFRAKIKEKYDRLAEEHLANLRHKLAEREMAELRAWENKHKELVGRTEDLERQKLQYQAEVNERYDQALEAAAYSQQKLREELEKKCQVELESRDKKIQLLEQRRLEEMERLRDEFMKHEAQREEELRRYEERVMVNYEKQLQAHSRRTETLRDEQEVSDMKVWEERESEVLARKAQLERHRLKYERETRHKFDELLRKMQQASEEARQRLDEQHITEVQRKTTDIDATRQKKLLAISQLKGQLEAFVSRQQDTMAEFEQQLSLRFHQQGVEQIRRQELEHKRMSDEELTRWEQRMQDLRTRERTLEVSKSEYEETVRSKFDNMLRQKQEDNLFQRKEMERKFASDVALKEKALQELDGKCKTFEEQISDLLAKSAAREETSRAYEEEIETKYRMQIQQHTDHTDHLIAERDALDVVRWGKKEAEFRARCEAIEEARHGREMSLRAMHDKIISQISEEEANAIENLEREFTLKFKACEREVQGMEDKRGEMERTVKELMQHELEMTAVHKRKEDELVARYEKQLSDHMDSTASSMRAAEAELTRKWGTREAELLDRAHAMEKTRLQVEEELRAKYDMLLKQHQDQDDALVKELERLHSKELKRKEDQILENIKKQQDERRDVENKIRQKYLDMVKRYQNDTNAAKQSALQHEMQNIESKAALERERAEMFEAAEKQAEAEAKEKYRKLLLALQEDWRREAAQRERRVEERLREEYEARITMVQLRLEEADGSPSRPQGGMAEVTKFKSEQNVRLDQFRTALRNKHDAMLNQYRQLEEEEISRLEAAVATQQEKVEGKEDARTMLERKVKMAFGKWRVDYQGHMREKYQPLVREIKELHSKYTSVLHERQQQEIERGDTEAQRERMKAMRDKLHREEEARLKKEARERCEDEERRLHEGHANSQRLREAKEQIQTLWDALEVDGGERHAFYKKVLGQNTNMDVVKICQAECGRLGRQLPVIQLITKVEAKSGQLDTVRKSIKEAALAGSSPMQMQQRDTERDQLSAELTQLNEELRAALDEYEAETGQTMLYRGRPYHFRFSSAQMSPKKSTNQSPNVIPGRVWTPQSPRSPAWK